MDPPTTLVSLTNDPIDSGAVLNQMLSADCGAVSLFLGTTRNDLVQEHPSRQHQEVRVHELIYEAYDSMALKEMHKLVDEVRSRFMDVKNVSLIHRLGRVPVKEASVLVCCVGGHRDEALIATRWLIDELKSRVPIWKKEIFEDGSAEWK